MLEEKSQNETYVKESWDNLRMFQLFLTRCAMGYEFRTPQPPWSKFYNIRREAEPMVTKIIDRHVRHWIHIRGTRSICIHP